MINSGKGNKNVGEKTVEEEKKEKISGDEHWNRWQQHNKNKTHFVSTAAVSIVLYLNC